MLDFTFHEDTHEYRTAAGQSRPSITQMLTRVGIYDFSHVAPDVLENARRRGTNVHNWCAEIDKHGWVDESWVAEDELPYVQAWERFSRDFKVKAQRTEEARMATVAGFLFGGTPDVEGLLDGAPCLIERKACAQKHPGWAIQTAMQEMLVTGRPRVGHMLRVSAQLLPTGKYVAHTYEDYADGDLALAIFHKFAAEESLAAWKSNHRLRPAA